jgi:hypothetical protein
MTYLYKANFVRERNIFLRYLYCDTREYSQFREFKENCSFRELIGFAISVFFFLQYFHQKFQK